VDFLGIRMKLKPFYIYALLITAALIFLFIFTMDSGKDVNTVSDKEMPDDEIHKSFRDSAAQNPGRGNVSSVVKDHIEMLRKKVEANPQDTLLLKQYADMLAQAHRPKEAIVHYFTILNVNPGRTDVLFALAYVYYNMKDYDNTEKMTNRILLYDEDNVQAKFNLGVIAAARGEKEKAKLIWEKLVKENPGSDIARKAKESINRI
jgi:tetratricopeptide (TPR) repeat protein